MLVKYFVNPRIITLLLFVFCFSIEAENKNDQDRLDSFLMIDRQQDNYKDSANDDESGNQYASSINLKPDYILQMVQAKNYSFVNPLIKELLRISKMNDNDYKNLVRYCCTSSLFLNGMFSGFLNKQQLINMNYACIDSDDMFKNVKNLYEKVSGCCDYLIDYYSKVLKNVLDRGTPVLFVICKPVEKSNYVNLLAYCTDIEYAKFDEYEDDHVFNLVRFYIQIDKNNGRINDIKLKFDTLKKKDVMRGNCMYSTEQESLSHNTTPQHHNIGHAVQSDAGTGWVVPVKNNGQVVDSTNSLTDQRKQQLSGGINNPNLQAVRMSPIGEGRGAWPKDYNKQYQVYTVPQHSISRNNNESTTNQQVALPLAHIPTTGQQQYPNTEKQGTITLQFTSDIESLSDIFKDARISVDDAKAKSGAGEKKMNITVSQYHALLQVLKGAHYTMEFRADNDISDTESVYNVVPKVININKGDGDNINITIYCGNGKSFVLVFIPPRSNVTQEQSTQAELDDQVSDETDQYEDDYGYSMDESSETDTNGLF